MFLRMRVFLLSYCLAIFSLGAITHDPAPENSRVIIGTMTYARQSHTATLLPNGNVLIVGWDSKTAELFDPATGLFSTTGATVANHKQGLTATLLNSGKVLIAGGVNALRVAELYDPATGLFTLTDSLRVVHSYHTATMLPDGRVLIAAGQDHTGPQTHAVAELYDPTTGTFALTDSLNEHRSAHTATLLPDGTVLIAGGIQTTTPGSGIYISFCEVYDPSTASFTLTAAMKTPRVAHAATMLGNGHVLISGGAWYSNTCELYSCALQTWTQTDTMTVTRRNYHTANLLADGRVLLTGGSTGEITATVEVYDTATSTFSRRDTMTTRRMSHASTRLTNGDILLTGGYDGAATLKSAELIDGSVPTAVPSGDPSDGSGTRAASMVLRQNYPNPFNPTTTIRFTIAGVVALSGSEGPATKVRLVVYDLLGREVKVLMNEWKELGTHEVTFDAKELASGMYIYRVTAGGFVQARKMILVK